ncbi:cytochrome P450 [Lophiostoma macrostomum CBS 122681]|uniref:Cytochrome P450 n=1 Tax=Lophiostoma macrostomum CBS 122681 TaxID=1314788 RepID=A0A6A6SM30_9PLEO|nr:cytochrome P450 [Lophiostoma macrostomum CBS 122681]
MIRVSLYDAIPFVTLLILAFLLSPNAIRWYSRRTLARRYGCKKPPIVHFDLAPINAKAAQEHTFLETTKRLFDEHGKTFKATRFGRTFIRTCDPEVTKAVLSTHFENFGMQPIRYEGRDGFFGDGMLATDGHQWKRSRTLIRPTFDNAHIANFDRLRSRVDRFIEILPRDGSTIDMFPLLKRLTLDISSEFIFGRSMNALSSPEACQDFIDAFKAALKDVATPPKQRSPDYERTCKEVHDLIEHRIEEAFERVADTGEKDIDIKHVRIVDDLARATQDKHTLKHLVLSVFSPAHDAVAVAVTNAIFHLARNANCWTKLRAEISLVGSRPLTYELLNSFQYLSWVLKETHRITPLNAGTLRECLSTTVLPCGGGNDGLSPLLVEKGDLIDTNWYAKHRARAFWGEDADEFRPERWAIIRPSWEYTPFSGGPRICPAIRLVNTECEYILATIVREFERLENRDEVLEWVEERRLTFQSLNGAKVGLIC